MRQQNMSHRESIATNYSTLIRCTNLNDYIVACLRAAKVIDIRKHGRLQTEKVLHERCLLLYEWLKEESEGEEEEEEKCKELFQRFLGVMEENEQEHVSNLLKAIRDEPHVPLSDWRYNRLTEITPKLMKIIHNNEELVAFLISKNAISFTDCQDVDEKKSNYKRNSVLVRAIARRSNYSYDCFEKALRETHQNDTADYLTEGEVTVVHVKTNQPEFDERLSDELNRTIEENYRTEENSNVNILDGLKDVIIHPVAAEHGHSILIFLYCKTVPVMKTLTDLWTSGRLLKIVEDILNQLMSELKLENKERLRATLTLDDEEIILIRRFTSIKDWMPDIADWTRRSAETQTDNDDLQELRKTELEMQLEVERTENQLYDARCKMHDDEGYKTWIAGKGCSASRMRMLRNIASLSTMAEQANSAKSAAAAASAATDDDDDDDDDKNRVALIHSIETNFEKVITGLTILDDELFIVRRKRSEIDVYDSTSNCKTEKRILKLTELIDPFDIGSCSRNKHLFIIDCKDGIIRSNEILRFDSNGTFLNRWSTGDNIGRLSVTFECHVILTVKFKSTLNEYSPDGQLIREIQLPDSVIHPRHAIKLTSGHFIVINGSSEDSLHRVCEVDVNGNFLRSFGGRDGSADRRLNHPGCLAVDLEEGSIVVVDQENNRMFLLNSKLEFMEEIASEKHQLQNLWRIHLDESNGRLVVFDRGCRNLSVLRLDRVRVEAQQKL